MKNIIPLACFILLFYGLKEAFNKPPTENEIANLGNGFALFHNLDSTEKFAIVQPPLAGLLSFSILKMCSNFDSVSAVPSQNYFDMLGFINALEAPNTLGQQVIDKSSNLKIARSVNLCLVVILLLILARRNCLLSGLAALMLYPASGVIASATAPMLSALLVTAAFQLMVSILRNKSSSRFILLGIVIGLVIASAGASAFILCGISICTPLIMHDWNNKTRSRGFSPDGVRNIGLCFFVAGATAWLAYGMDLACLCQLQTLLGFAPTSSLRVVPFFDPLKQFVFEILFQPQQHIYSFRDNFLQFFDMTNSVLSLLILVCSLRHFHNYSLFSLLLLLSALFYNDPNHAKITLFFDTVSLTLTISAVLLLNNISDIKKSRKD